MTERVGPTPNAHAPRGTCRWCMEPITKDGKPQTRYRWHHAQHDGGRSCIDEWRATQPGLQYMPVAKRDGETCNVCGWDLQEATERQAATCPATTNPEYGTEAYYRERDEMVRWRLAGRYLRLECDHVVPLIDGGANAMPNLQLLCVPCHKAKTKREAGERAARRRENVVSAQLMMAVAA